MGLDSRYLCILQNLSPFVENASFARLLSCAVYGFPAVYEHYAQSVLPIVNWSRAGILQIGTCFVVAPQRAITALHCVQPAKALAIRGVPKEELAKASFYSHSKEALDLVVISFDKPVFGGLPAIAVPDGEPQILNEVIALGYPNIPSFIPALAAEAAQVSGRLAVSRGRIASAPTEIFAGTELLLITARVRGGFSGGPILDTYGQAVGMVSREPMAETGFDIGPRYDELGYGVAVSCAVAHELLGAIKTGDSRPLSMPQVDFRDFDEC